MGPKESRDPWKGPDLSRHLQEALNLTMEVLGGLMLGHPMNSPIPILAGLLSPRNVLSTVFGVIAPGPSGICLVCCRDFKGIILTLLWEDNDHLLNVAEVRTAAHRPLPAPLRAIGHMSPAASASCNLPIMALWVKLRKGDASPHDQGYAAKHHSFIYPLIQPPNISLTLTVCQILSVSM